MTVDALPKLSVHPLTEEAGFTECLRRSKTRPVMRYYAERRGARKEGE